MMSAYPEYVTTPLPWLPKMPSHWGIARNKNIFLLHEELITETGGAVGIRDEGLLDSALAAPFQSFEGHTPYPSLQQKAARLGYSLVKDHPFVDGNKRIGTHAMLVFLALNRVDLDYTQEELADTFFSLASDLRSCSNGFWLTSNSVSLMITA